ncbi:MAG: DUF6261 family protein [Bacteroidales bacterium]|jgi:hypothetical protein|nr:DUF6261 family protein [Bacteroidales bacterium]
MKQTIARVHYKDLWNSEFPNAAQRTIAIAGKYDMNEMHLGKSYGNLAVFLPQLANMIKSVGKNEKLAKANEIDRERDTLIKVSYKIVKCFKPVRIDMFANAYKAVSGMFEKHRAGSIAGASITSQSERITALEKDYNENTAVRNAAAALGIAPLLERLFAANKEYEILFRDYIADKSAEQHIDISALRSSCSKAIGMFFDSVEYCTYQHDDVDYNPLVNELNTLNNYYRTRIKTRTTLRKNNRKEKVETIPPPPEPEE